MISTTCLEEKTKISQVVIYNKKKLHAPTSIASIATYSTGSGYDSLNDYPV